MNNSYFNAALVAGLLTAAFFFAGVMTQFYFLLVLAAVSGIITVIAGMRASTTASCPACKSTIPAGATICRSCRTSLA